MRALLIVILGVAAGCADSDAVWSSSVTRLVLHDLEGFGPLWHATAECPHMGVEYTLVVADRSLSTVRCTPDTAEPHRLIRTAGSRTLTTAELDALVPELEALRVVSVDGCIVDGPLRLVTVTTPSAVTEYGDSSNSCDKTDDRPRIETSALGAAAHAFELLAPPAS